MLFGTAIRSAQEVTMAPVVAPAPSVTEIVYCEEKVSKDELRRQMYERIAAGNALAEAEEHAHQIWKGQ